MNTSLRNTLNELTAINRRAPDAAIECQLADLRLRAFHDPDKKMESSVASGVWPPVINDPFIGRSFARTGGIPEITLDELNINTLAAGILHHGSVIVRGLLQSTQAQALISDIDRVLAAQAARAAGAPLSETTPWFAPPDFLSQFKLGVGRKFIAETGGIWAIDSPRALFHVLELYEQLGLRQLLTEYFGEAPCLSVRKWVLRRVAPLPQESDWHQDGSFMGTRVRSANLWIALNRCGADTDTPGIELIPKRLDHIVPTGTHGARFEWVVGPQAIPELFADTPPVSPLFEPGDAVFFDHFNLHRTAYGSHITQNRYAIECWFFAQSAYPEEQIPLVF
jgi:hypothetical protein